MGARSDPGVGVDVSPEPRVAPLPDQHPGRPDDESPTATREAVEESLVRRRKEGSLLGFFPI